MPTINRRYPFELFKVDVDLNTLKDYAINVNFGRFAVRTFTLTGASTSLAASAAQVGLYTAPSKGGTAISTSAVATALTTSAKLQDRTLATTDTQTGGVLYVNVGVVHGAPATCVALIEVQKVD